MTLLDYNGVKTLVNEIKKYMSDMLLSNKPTIPTNVSELTNDSKYITAAETEDLKTEVERLQDMIYTGVARMYLVTNDGSNLSTDSGESLESWQSIVITYPD